MTPEEMIAKVQECTARLGHAPTVVEFLEMSKMTRRQVRKNFGSYTRMLSASGVERHGSGYPISMRCLFLDWAQITRSLGKVPTVADYERLSQYSVCPLNTRFGTWREVPAGLLVWARKEGLESEWKDVLDIIVLQQQWAAKLGQASIRSSTTVASSISRPRPLGGRAAYGRPLPHSSMSYAPTNEAGVVLLFGSVARELGFVIMRAQAEFPDCEAMREIAPNCWERVRIEFEYESRNFCEHMHPATECDLIVCWSHNWPDCPVEVLELQGVVGNFG